MFDFLDNGSIVLIFPEDDAAAEHAAEVYEGAEWFGGAVACEPRYAMENAKQLMDEGFTVKIDGREVADIEPV